MLLGGSGFKIVRLLFALALAIHVFACAFYKVLNDHRTPEDVQLLLDAKGVAPDVSSNAARTIKHSPPPIDALENLTLVASFM